jgi:hypothetical protein
MRKDMEIKLGSTVVGRINSVRMSEVERQTALNAMRDADLLVDAFVWVVKKIEQIGERLFLKPSLKHSLKH